MRRSKRQMSATFVMIMTFATPLAAAELSVEPRLAAGASYYNLDIDGAVVVGDDSVDNVEFSDFLYLVGGGLTLSKDRFFIDFYGQYSFDGEDELDLDAVVGGVEANNVVQDVEFDRFETALTVGYRITDQFAAFIGFRYADVDFDGSGSLGAVSVDLSTELNQKGPFFGVGYVVPTTIFNGAFVGNAAVAYLDGDLDNEIESSALSNDASFDVDGTAIGFNVGASWVTPLSDQLKLVVGADVAQYRFKDDDDETDFDELITRIRTELRYTFDVGSLGPN